MVRAHLPDNAREAIQFMLLAAGVLVAMRVGFAALEWWLAPAMDDALGQAIAPFRRDYLLRDPHSVVPAAMALPGRLAIAVLASIFGAVLSSVLGGVTAVLVRGNARRWMLGSARLGLLLWTLPALFSATTLPVSVLKIHPEGIVVVVRHALPGDIAVPATAQRTFVPWQEVTVHPPIKAMEGLHLDTPMGRIVIGSAGPDQEVEIHVLADALRALADGASGQSPH